MNDAQFDVIVDGQPLPEFDATLVLAQLQQQLKLPEAKARQLLAAKAVVVKRAVSCEIAQAYCRRLLAIGVATRVMPTATTSSSPAAVVTTNYFESHPVPLTAARASSIFSRELWWASLRASMVLGGYMAMTLAVILLLVGYLFHFSYLLVTPPLLFSICVFIIPLLGLGLLVALLLRPLLPLQTRTEATHALDRTEQPQLFAFIDSLCASLAVPTPQQISLSVSERNDVALVRGINNFFRGTYRLTLSLPLLDAAPLNEFAATLAGDIATQAKWPALYYRLLRQRTLTRIAVCTAGNDWLQRRCTALSRRCDHTRFKFMRAVLHYLMLQSNRSLQQIVQRFEHIDLQFIRARQFEHDRYRALIGGVAVVTKILVLESKLERAVADAEALNRQQLDTGKLVDDFPALVNHYFVSLDDGFSRQLKKLWETQTISRRREPAIARERIEHSWTAKNVAIVVNDEPAAVLLQQRSEWARRITVAHYRELGWPVNPDNLLAVDDLTYAATQDILQRQQAEVYFNNWLRPFRFWSLADYQLIRDMPLQDAAQQLNVCINEIRRLTPDRAKLLAEYQRLNQQIQEILLGQHVLAVGKKFAFRYVAYDGTTLQPILEEKQQLLTKVLEQLSMQETVMGGRITLGFRLCGQAERDVELLHDALRLLHDCGARLDKLALDAYQLEQLLGRHYRQREADYSAAIKRLEQKIDDTLMLLLARLSSITDPLDPAHHPLKYRLDAELLKIAEGKDAILQRARCTLDTLYGLNEKLSLLAADYGTTAEEAYRIEPIKLIKTTL